MSEPVPITGVHVYRIGDDLGVALEIDGQWVRVINTLFTVGLSHIVEAAGIERARREATP